MLTLATRFVAILAGLRAAIANHTVKDRPREALFVLAWTRIGRMANRFQALFARWQAGTLPAPRPSRAGQPRASRPHPRLPRGRAWVVAHVGYQAANHASQLQHLLADPDMAAFLQAVPQAGRILRPLCHVLGIDPPPTPPSPGNAPSPAQAETCAVTRTPGNAAAPPNLAAPSFLRLGAFHSPDRPCSRTALLFRNHITVSSQ